MHTRNIVHNSRIRLISFRFVSVRFVFVSDIQRRLTGMKMLTGRFALIGGRTGLSAELRIAEELGRLVAEAEAGGDGDSDGDGVAESEDADAVGTTVSLGFLIGRFSSVGLDRLEAAGGSSASRFRFRATAAAASASAAAPTSASAAATACAAATAAFAEGSGRAEGGRWRILLACSWSLCVGTAIRLLTRLHSCASLRAFRITSPPLKDFMRDPAPKVSLLSHLLFGFRSTTYCRWLFLSYCINPLKRCIPSIFGSRGKILPDTCLEVCCDCCILISSILALRIFSSFAT